MRKVNLTKLFASWILSLAIVCTALGKIIYVDYNASGTNNGNSWVDAYNDLQDALASAQTGDEIRVAQGIYTPTGPIAPIPPGQAGNPYPADGAIDVNVHSNLSWTAGADTCIYDVYFGTSSPPLFVGTQSSLEFVPGTMDQNTTYHWRIDSVNISGKTTGIDWSFTTHEIVLPPPPPPPPPPPTESMEQAIATAISRTDTFQLINGVVIKGGYAGSGEPDPDARDFELYETILSGDIGLPCDKSDNSYHVVTGSGTDETAVLDGFNITAGNANGSSVDHHGGGMVNLDGSPTLTNCMFNDNSADYGGGMYNDDHSSPTLTNCTFSGNTRGGMYNDYRSSPTLTNCTFSGNSGGGMENDFSSPTLTNCTFSGNSGGGGGGGMRNNNSSPTLNNCTFIHNTARHGGGMHNEHGSPTLTNCTFRGNSAEYGGGMHNWHFTTPVLTDCTFTGNLAQEEGGGMHNNNWSNPTLTNCVFAGNISSLGGGMFNFDGSPTLTNCIIRYNAAYGEEGPYIPPFPCSPGLPCPPPSSPSGIGGGMYNNGWSNPTLTNCIISDNRAIFGAPMYCKDISSPTLINCTVSGNRELFLRHLGGILNESIYSLLLKNCILWANSYEEQITGPADVTYSNIQGGYAGEGNIDADPCFVQPLYLNWSAYWKFDEADGEKVYDFVGYSDGHLYGPQRAAGQVHNALSFDGIDDFVYTQSVPHRFEAITLQAWIYPQRDSHWHVLDKGNGKTRLYSEGSGLTLDGNISYTGDNAFVRSVSNTVILNTWQNVALTWSKADDTTRLYHNGVEVDYSIITIGTGSPEDTGSNLVIGASGTFGESTFFDGLIDEVAIYDRVLSVDEIRQNYQSCLTSSGYFSVNLSDYHLLTGSPCIDTADNNSLPADTQDLDGDGDMNEPIPFDLDGNLRIVDGRKDGSSVVDMGAYEFYNSPPVACIVGGNKIIEANGIHTKFTLDGSCSSDLDSTLGTIDDINDCIWYELDPCDPNAEVLLGSGVIIDCNLTIGEHIIVLEVIDNAGASDTKEVTIIVQDSTPPVISCPEDVTLECPADTSVEANGSATADDTCSSVTITNSDLWQQSCGNTGILTRTWTATDESGNSSTCVQIITVVDTTPPDFELSVSPTMLWPPDHKMYEITASWTVSDDCGTSPYVLLVGIVTNEGDNTVGDGRTSDDIQLGEDGSIYLRSERSGTGTDRVYTITYQAVDDCGNTTVRSATVSIPHDFKVLARIAARWLWSGPAGRIPEDLNGDGVVNLADFARFAENWIK